MQRHETYMRRALELATRGWGRASPNPMVGAIVVSSDDVVVGEGWYEGPRGNPHAEVVALRQAGDRTRGATLYCTLEPCDHHGSTPPCTDAVIAAGVTRAVIGAGDPNPAVDGRGFAKLRAAGIEVHDGVLGDEAHALNEAFERHVTTGRPYVVLKFASSLDGKTAAADGTSKWITSEAARADAQRLRAWADAVVVGARTAQLDDPELTVRDPRWVGARPPVRVLLDAAGGTPPTARMFDRAAPTLVATTARAPDAAVRGWQEAGAEVVVLEPDLAAGVSIDAVLGALGKRDVQGVLVEGGAAVAWSFLRDGFVDRIVAYLAPKLVGGAGSPGIVAGAGFAPVEAAMQVEFDRIDRVGPDLRVEAHVHRDR
jgi:diaminohydroxyphosphoribosylaminopyrimidine deaminase / 5-amino-6-(5-phosphoribosylamino)uracil reductase